MLVSREQKSTADLWIHNPKWEEYEAYVCGALQRLLPGATVRRHVFLPGTKTGRQRQTDVLVERKVGVFELKIAVDCKCYHRKVNVNDVERFLGMLDDVRVSKGVLMTTKGYTKTALQRIQNESRDIELRILTAERLSEFQSIGCAILWKGDVGAIASPPDTWVVDNERTPGSPPCQFSMYPLGHTRESAMRLGGFLYGNIVLKSEHEPTMEAIAQRHEVEVIHTWPMAKFERLPPVQRSNWGDRPAEQTLFRVGYIDKGYRGPEYSLYIDHPKGVLVLVLLCPEGQDDTYVPVLKWIGRMTLMMDCEQEVTERAKILEIVRTEFHKHRFDYYAEPVPNSNRKNIVPGCSVCRVRAQTVSQYVDHLEERVIAAIEQELSNRGNTVNRPYCLPIALHKISLAPPS